MRPLIFSALFLSLTCLSSCAQQAEGTRGFGAVITDDGFKSNTDRNQRDAIIEHLTHDIDAALTPNWTARVHIDELPTWVPSVDPADGDWRWHQATVHITLLGNGSLAHTVEEIRTGVSDYLSPRVIASKTHLLVSVVLEPLSAPLLPVPLLPTAQPSTAVASSVAVSGPRTYTIQAGDTLADISTLFYGAPEHWRLIVNANPSLNPAALAPGSVVTIPPRP